MINGIFSLVIVVILMDLSFGVPHWWMDFGWWFDPKYAEIGRKAAQRHSFDDPEPYLIITQVVGPNEDNIGWDGTPEKRPNGDLYMD